MTIIEGNKLIMDFLEWKRDFPGTAPKDKRVIAYFEGPNGENWHCFMEEGIGKDVFPAFNKDYNLLLFAIEKINITTLDEYGEMGVYIYPFQCFIGYDIHEPITLVQRLDKTLIEMVWTTITTFIQWHNTIKSKVN